MHLDCTDSVAADLPVVSVSKSQNESAETSQYKEDVEKLKQFTLL